MIYLINKSHSPKYDVLSIVRFTYLFQVLDNVQSYLLESSPDDTDSLNALTTLYDILVLCFGLDEDDLHNNTEVSIY